MSRGKQKEQARERAQARSDANKGGKSQLDARAAGVKIVCPVCMAPMAAYKALAMHYESKHPKAVVPAESTFAAK
ncbi:DUF1909-domain-containing protein [Ramicandelaber brevisporus]|nr:DUF1909-domain-containing protein [Ramicandelaber brevisporus]